MKHEILTIKLFAPLRKIKFRFCFFLYFFFISLSISYSQINKEPVPVFVLQGTVKLKGKPIEGVSLELTKDKKTLSKIITRKNGLYSFQMDKSNTDPEIEYLLNIVKDNAITGVLRINTYTLSGEFDYIPYVFNLEINLTPSVFPASSGLKENFGKIKWDSGLGIFDFDKEYEKKIDTEKDSLKTHSSKYLAEIIEKIEKEEEEKRKKTEEEGIAKTKEMAMQLTDSLTAKKLEKEKSKQDITNLKVSSANKSDPDPGNKKELISTNKKENIPDDKKGVNAAVNPPNLKKELEISAADNSGRKKEAVTEKKEFTNNNRPLEMLNSQETVVGGNKQSTGKTNKIFEPETKKPTVSAAKMSKEFFDGAAVFLINGEKSHLLNVKEKMERKKAANLAKKYETNNTLTSLLDMVEENDNKSARD